MIRNVGFRQNDLPAVNRPDPNELEPDKRTSLKQQPVQMALAQNSDANFIGFNGFDELTNFKFTDELSGVSVVETQTTHQLIADRTIIKSPGPKKKPQIQVASAAGGGSAQAA